MESSCQSTTIPLWLEGTVVQLKESGQGRATELTWSQSVALFAWLSSGTSDRRAFNLQRAFTPRRTKERGALIAAPKGVDYGHRYASQNPQPLSSTLSTSPSIFVKHFQPIHNTGSFRWLPLPRQKPSSKSQLFSCFLFLATTQNGRHPYNSSYFLTSTQFRYALAPTPANDGSQSRILPFSQRCDRFRGNASGRGGDARGLFRGWI